MRIDELIRGKICSILHQQSIYIEHEYLIPGLHFTQPIKLHGRFDHIGDSDSCRAGAEHQYPLIFKNSVVDAHGTDQSCDCNAGCSLDIIIVTTYFIFITGEQPDSINTSPVLEVYATCGENI